MLFLDMMSGSGFNARIQEVAAEFRNRAGIPLRVYQAGVLVPDVVKAAIDLESQGFGPFMISSASLPRWTERGAERHFKGTMGLAYHDGIEIELLEPGTGSDFYRQCVDPQGRPVLHHIGFLTRSVDTWADTVSALGCPAWVRGRIGVGPLSIDFAYMDTVREAGTILEFIGYRFAGIPVNPIPGLVRGVGMIQKRIGKRRIDFG
ncbi:MAG: VOC family protein [Spirochaetes bacterium]|nr:VOC family protein [Spirochaetota bacterium]